MKMVGRFVKFLVSNILKLCGVLLATVFRFFLLPVFLAIFRVLRGLVFISFAATVTGPVRFSDRIAAEWTERSLELGASRDRIDVIFRLCRLVARSMIVLGWLIAAFFTLIILRVVFGYFI